MNNVPKYGPCMSSIELKRRMNRDIQNWFTALINKYRSNHIDSLCNYKDIEIIAYQLHIYARERLYGISIMLFHDDYKLCLKKWLIVNNIAIVYQEVFLSQIHFVRSWSVRDTIPSPELWSITFRKSTLRSVDFLQS